MNSDGIYLLEPFTKDELLLVNVHLFALRSIGFTYAWAAALELLRWSRSREGSVTLTSADLTFAQLSKADLSGANLQSAQLTMLT